MRNSEIVAGVPAMFVLPHDSIAAVVVRRTPKRVIVARVETGPLVVEEVAGPGAITSRPGILDQPIAGTETTLTIRERRDGSVFADNGDGWRVVFGHSESRQNSINF